MDYEIAFDDNEQSYRVVTNYEFSAIADWVSEHLQAREEIQKVLQIIQLVKSEPETKDIEYGIYSVSIGSDGITVIRQLDMSDASEEMSAIFENQSSSYQISDDGVKSECGLDDLTNLLENWFKVLY